MAFKKQQYYYATANNTTFTNLMLPFCIYNTIFANIVLPICKYQFARNSGESAPLNIISTQ